MPRLQRHAVQKELDDNLNVCRHCGFHLKLDPVRRLETLFDDGNYKTIDVPKVVADPLKFRDQKNYADRLRDAQHKTKRQDAIVVGEGYIGGVKTVIAVFDFSFMGGSMGMGVGEAIVTAARRAVATKSALLYCPHRAARACRKALYRLCRCRARLSRRTRLRMQGCPLSSC